MPQNPTLGSRVVPTCPLMKVPRPHLRQLGSHKSGRTVLNLIICIYDMRWLSGSRYVAEEVCSGSKRDRQNHFHKLLHFPALSSASQLCHASRKVHSEFVTPTDISHHLSSSQHEIYKDSPGTTRQLFQPNVVKPSRTP